MTKLLDKIECVMRKADPLMLNGDYYYEARNMIVLLTTWPHSASIRQLCEESFQIRPYLPDYDYDVERWETMVTEITWLLEKTVAEKRMKKIQNELLATAMSPERMGSIVERYGTSAAYDTFA
jgi:hypothetical protein